ncbi:MAG: glyceraldehyde 3-phosphate dehydrogenase NAD-binding domain-containing protein [Thermodesulfobacteriota bacterium]|nr:glyceraldehyde 3-phosphate dehydrogenase NAD-binding domain-containing protein [Thermodesulfobacteriota bacterium]
MTFSLAINGYGRIGRCVLRALYETGHREKMRIAAINELAAIESIAHLTRFDSTHGRFAGDVIVEGDTLYIDDDPIRVFGESDMEKLPWGELGVDLVLECSGRVRERHMAEKHLKSGAKKVMFSCPADREVDATIVYGINHQDLQSGYTVISNASCTSNCIVPVIKVLDDALGIEHGMITTIHSLMNDQPVIDAYHNRDLRRSRSSSQSVIPVKTELPRGIARILPHMTGRFEAMALRVPTINVSAIHLNCFVRTPTDAATVNTILRDTATGGLRGVLGYTDLPLVSWDFNHDPHSAVIDGIETRVSGKTGVNVLAWFDNEWGYANRMLDTALAFLTA